MYKTAESVPHSTQLFNKYFEIPRNPSPLFTDREKIFTRLKDACLPANPTGIQSKQRRYVLHGLGGSGKTQLCLKFAEEYRHKYDACLEIN